MTKSISIKSAMDTAFPTFGHDVCHWAMLMTQARTTRFPSVKADRLRAAAETRTAMSRTNSLTINR